MPVQSGLPTPASPLRIGTRGSPLALAQAEETRDRLMAAHGLDAACFVLTPIRTTGDRVQDRSLSEIGGKGLFTKELENALISREIDIAVHSMKDVATLLPAGLAIETCLPRADIRDAFVSLRHSALDGLARNAVFGTSSLRRRAQILALYPDLQMVDFRGNVQTRLAKLEEGLAEATLLACAGLARLGQAALGTPIEPDILLPAPAQGAIGIQHRAGDELAILLAPLNDLHTQQCVEAERAFLAALDGSCRTPIAALALREGNRISFRGEILRPDGSEKLERDWEGPVAQAADTAFRLGAELKSEAGEGFFA